LCDIKDEDVVFINIVEMTNRVLIDADFIAWKICPNKVLTETEIMYGITSEKTLEEVYELVDWYLQEKIFIPTGAISYIGFLGGKGNFRKELDDSYKEGRSYELPKYFNEAKQYLVDKWGFIKVDGIEAEDSVGICLTKYPDAVIVCEDHDLLQLPGTQYNPSKQIWLTHFQEEADYNFWKQCLTGCSTDKVKGVPRIGPVKAAKIINDVDKHDWKYVILQSYINYFGEYKGVEEFAKNYKLLRILREKEGFDTPEFIDISKVESDNIIKF